MSDEEKCLEEGCDCDNCKLIRKFGYAGAKDWAEEFLQPIVVAVSETVAKQRRKIDEKRVAGTLTPDEADELNGMVLSGAINQLQHIAAKLAHLHGNSLGTFCGNAAEHWDHTRMMPGHLIPIPNGLLRTLIETLVSDEPDPFSPPPQGEKKTN